MFKENSVRHKLRRVMVGKEKNPLDRNIFHSISLIAFFAWVGLGADGLSSSCYGPEEAFLALGSHGYLSLIVGVMAVVTIFIISASYSQIIERFPSGGGGYLVASKLLSPAAGMISGCALLIDYVLTIAISVASASDAIFSFLPISFGAHKIYIALFGVMMLIILNLRGAKESVMPLVPIFVAFILAHLFVIAYSLITHATMFPAVMKSVGLETSLTASQIGWFATLVLLMKAYSLGAGTYTGIEAVSNGLPILREPKVETGKKTMRYMAISLSTIVLGLMAAYLLYRLEPVPGKTLNAVLFEKITSGWGIGGKAFLGIILISEALILFIAAQAGFLDGPRVLANMAMDRWFPSSLASLSDRLVTQNGIMLMGIAAIITMAASRGSVKFLVVLYSINVFITFCLSQSAMVKHWYTTRGRRWKRKLALNGVGLLLCLFILASVVILKFKEGGWITLVVTGALAVLAAGIKRHYFNTLKVLHRLNSLLEASRIPEDENFSRKALTPFDPKAKTAVIFVNGYNGLGLHSLFAVVRLFGKEFKNYVFVQIGILDAGNFKGAEEVDNLDREVRRDVEQYAEFMRRQGRHAEGISFIEVDVVSGIKKIGPEILKKYPNATFFGGQLVFRRNTIFDRWLHNYTVFTMQRQFYHEGIPFIILPIRVDSNPA